MMNCENYQLEPRVPCPPMKLGPIKLICHFRSSTPPPPQNEQQGTRQGGAPNCAHSATRLGPHCTQPRGQAEDGGCPQRGEQAPGLRLHDAF
jgi:hypothetical protein